MSRGCALWMSESKGQRSRSQCSDYWKWFLAHICFPFTSAIIKLHAQIPFESRICLTDIGVKNLRSLNWLPRGVFVPLGQPHSSWQLCSVLAILWTTWGWPCYCPICAKMTRLQWHQTLVIVRVADTVLIYWCPSIREASVNWLALQNDINAKYMGYKSQGQSRIS